MPGRVAAGITCTAFRVLWYNPPVASSEHPSALVAADQVDQTSYLALQAWLAGSPWRLSGGWFFLAGLAAAGGLLRGSLPWVTLALGVVLTGMLWGGLWTQLTATRWQPDVYTARRPALPYVTPRSPAGRLAGWPEPGAMGRLVRVGLPLAGLAALIAYLLGVAALAATAVAMALTLTGGAASRAGLASLWNWLRALIVAGLPFALGVLVAGTWPDQPLGLWLLGLAAGYVLLAVSSTAVPDRQPAVAGLLIGVLGAALVAGILIVANLPVAAVLTLLLTAPPLLTQSGRQIGRFGAPQAWWLAAVLCSAVALGFGIG